MSAIFAERNRPLSVREREQIRNRIRENEQTLTGRVIVRTNGAIKEEGVARRREGHYAQFLRDDINEDAGLLRQKIARDKQMLERGDPKNISRKDRASIEKQVKRDSEWVRKTMCPEKLFHTPRVKSDGTNHPNFARAVKACKREHTEEYKAVANRLKMNLRRLDPDSESNLEKFRPKH